jgi:iron(III) transport system permease protein
VVTGCAYLYVLLVIELPAGAQILGSIMRRFGFFQIRNPYTTANWTNLIHDNLFAISAMNSLKIGLGATVLGVVVYFAIKYVIVRSKLRRWRC